MLTGSPCSLDWQSRQNIVLSAGNSQTHKLLQNLITSKLDSHILIKTSGTTGKLRWVALAKRAILTSAHSVNQHLKASSSDKWLLALPDYHIGGLAILARAHLSQIFVDRYDYKWNPSLFVESLKEFGSTLTSLVPTQVYDLVQKNISSPGKLRAVLVGGGSLPNSIYSRGRELGWPLLPSYGLTECSSQVATAPLYSLESCELPDFVVLPHVSVEIMENNRVAIQSEALFSGYIEINEGLYEWKPLKEKKFLTEDVGKTFLKNNSLHLKLFGRVGHTKKVKGVLVNGFSLNQAFQSRFGMEVGEITLLPELRDEHEVVLISESQKIKEVLSAVGQFNKLNSVSEKISKVYFLDKIPRTELGKPVVLSFFNLK